MGKYVFFYRGMTLLAWSSAIFSFSGNSLWEITDKERARSLICKNLSTLCDDYENWIDELRDIKIDRFAFEEVVEKHIKNW